MTDNSPFWPATASSNPKGNVPGRPHVFLSSAGHELENDRQPPSRKGRKASDCCRKIVRCGLFVSNAGMLATGIVLAYVGVKLYNRELESARALDLAYHLFSAVRRPSLSISGVGSDTISSLLTPLAISVSSVILLSSLVGCCVCLRMRCCRAMTLELISLLFVGISVLGLLLLRVDAPQPGTDPGPTKDPLNGTAKANAPNASSGAAGLLVGLITRYKEPPLVDNNATSLDLNLSSEVHQAQLHYKCCGVFGYKDWEMNELFNDTIKVPGSCCTHQSDPEQCQVHPELCDPPLVGCYDVFMGHINGAVDFTRSVLICTGTFGGVSLAMASIVLFNCCFGCLKDP